VLKFSRVVFIVVFIVLVLLQVAASGNAQASALTIAGVVGAAAPFVIGFVKNQFHLNWDGRTMVAAATVVALVVALVALAVTGQLNLDDPTHMLETLAAAFSLEQLVFQSFKDSPRVGPLLK
jgi:fucose permease